jgi:signal transduction histidine kinase/ActR/RegA family two-component response regulator
MTTTDPQNIQDQRILILAPTGRDGQLTARFLRDDGLSVQVCERIEQLCREMLEGAGLVFLTGEALTPGATQYLVEALGRQPTWSDIPLVVLTSGGGGTPANAGVLATLGEAGNVTLIERPVRVLTLLSAVKSALRARRRQYQVREHLAREALSKQALQQSEERLREALDSEREARALAEEASRLKDEFLATVSHELRTPLTAVLGWTHLLRGGRLDAQASAHALETVERNARSQNQLIEDLLDVSRIITGKLRLDVRAVAPADVIEAAVEAVLPAAEAKDIRLQKVLDTKAGSISGDPSRLQQVVWNLLSNAIKFTPRGGRVHVRLERVNSHIEISVSDTGDGIRAEFLPFVFDRFRQADGSTRRQHGGLGLGLSIVRHLVELHGGTVRVDSAGEGGGATFTVKLPLVPVYRRDAGAERVHPAATDAHHPVEYPDKLDGLKVLVVDDEPDTLELIKELLSQCGAEVFTAASSAEALDLLRGVTPNVIVSDIGMPGEDGFEFIRKVRALPPERGGRIPAVALTAYARAEDRLRVLRSGYQMHVAKPVELAELVAIVSNVVGRA